MLKWLGKWVGIAVTGVYVGAVVVPLGPAVLMGPREKNWDHNWRYVRAVVMMDFATINALQSYNWFVSSAGSGSTCSMGSPCPLSYADGNAFCGAVISVADDGLYNESGGYLFTTSCASDENDVEWYGQGDGVDLTGLRIFPDDSAWTLAMGCGDGNDACSYTYVMDFDDETSMPNGAFIGVAHRANAGAVVPTIDFYEDKSSDCIPTCSSGEPVPNTELNHYQFAGPSWPPYRSLSSVAAVEAQFGSFVFDDVNEKLYVHFYEDTGVPTDDMLIGLAEDNAGAMIIDGADYQRFQNFNVAHASSSGYCVVFSSSPATTHISLIAVRGYSCAWAVRGDSHLLEDTLASIHHIQGTPTTDQGCRAVQGYLGEPEADDDPNPSFGFGKKADFSAVNAECFATNAGGGGGDMFSFIGASNITVRRHISEKGWGSGIGIDVCTNCLFEDMIVRYTVNHLCSPVNTDDVIMRRVVCWMGQEGTFSTNNGGPYDGNDNIRWENSLIYPFLSEIVDGSTGVQLYNNIFGGLLLGDFQVADATLDSDCNVVIEAQAAADVFMTEINEGVSSTNRTLAQWQSVSGEDANSKYIDNTGTNPWTTMFESVSFNSRPYADDVDNGGYADFHPADMSQPQMTMTGCATSYAGPYDAPLGEGGAVGAGARRRMLALLDLFVPPPPPLTKERYATYWHQAKWGHPPTVATMMRLR